MYIYIHTWLYMCIHIYIITIMMTSSWNPPWLTFSSLSEKGYTQPQPREIHRRHRALRMAKATDCEVLKPASFNFFRSAALIPDSWPWKGRVDAYATRCDETTRFDVYVGPRNCSGSNNLDIAYICLYTNTYIYIYVYIYIYDPYIKCCRRYGY